ncbi:endoglucanase [Enterococcus sp. CU12B]|uniref:Endoglucanase n=1 Tax=Candidatus Enterococcus willemsii TaxID=1857215 RepID=A0ABQ6Z126_9ENTE|nr:endoglucanase [Enterococcus sp. CU12B]
MKNSYKYGLLLLLCIIIGMGGFWWLRKSNEDLHFAKQLKVGWNLGNTFEAHDLHMATQEPAVYEMYWNNPLTTPTLLQNIKAAGFQTIRIPVTWEEHVNEEFQINEEWLERIVEVVDESLDAGLFVILNAHHDKWYTPDRNNFEEAKEKMTRLWTQLSKRFEEYDERLLFESMNEPRLIDTHDEWTTGPYEAQKMVNQLNDVFVQTVRQTGKMNRMRYLLLPTYAARYETAALEAFKLPNDSHLMVSIHLYAPAAFAQSDNSESHFDLEKDTQQIDDFFADVKQLFIKKKIPVVITEFAASDKENLDDRVRWTNYIVEKATKLGIPYIWWDSGGKNQTYGLYDRYQEKWLFPEILDVLIP